jgi:hypothetical protein
MSRDRQVRATQEALGRMAWVPTGCMRYLHFDLVVYGFLGAAKPV